MNGLKGKLGIFFTLFGCAAIFQKSQAQSTTAQLAHYYAPLHVQYTTVKGKNSLSGKSDLLTSFNFDGDWIATNNWENAANYDLPAVVYYSVVSTASHHFIQYAFFHPRDWTRTPFTKIGQHENDLEGILLIVARDTTPYGKCVGALSIFHHHIVMYTTQEYTSYRTSHFQKAPLSFEGNRPISAQQTKGHGCKAYGDMRSQGHRIALYVPEGEKPMLVDLPAMPIDTFTYTLVDIFEPNGLWEQRNNADFFAPNQTIKGDNGSGAKPPWRWQSSAWKKRYPLGTVALHPARIVLDYFSFEQPVDTHYIINPYQGIK